MGQARLGASFSVIANVFVRRLSTVLFAASLIELGVAGRSANAATIDFEGFPDSTVLTSQYLGLTFANTIVLTSGISLNEFELPPHSGVNVASDNNGPVTMTSARQSRASADTSPISNPSSLMDSTIRCRRRDRCIGIFHK